MEIKWQCQATFYAFYHLFLSCGCPFSMKKQHSFFCGKIAKKLPNWSQLIFKGGERKKVHTRTEGHVDFGIFTFKVYSHSKYTSSVWLTAETLSLIIKETDEVQMAACVLSWLLHKLLLLWMQNGSSHPSGIKMGLSLGNFVLHRTAKYLAHLYSLAWQGFNNEI